MPKPTYEYQGSFDLVQILEMEFGEDAESDVEQIQMLAGLAIDVLEDLRDRLKAYPDFKRIPALGCRVEAALNEMTL